MEKELRLWNLLCSKLKHLEDNNYTARKLYDYITKYYK